MILLLGLLFREPYELLDVLPPPEYPESSFSSDMSKSSFSMGK